MAALSTVVHERSTGVPPDTDVPSAVLVVLGKNWSRGRRRLSVESRLNVAAGVELFRRGIAPTLIFSGGHTAGRRHPSEAAEMARLARTLLPRAPAGAFLIEESSVDTAANSQKVRAMLRDMGPVHLHLVTTRNHLQAAICIFAAHGVPVAAASASEDVLRARSIHYAAVLDLHARSVGVRLDYLRERARLLLLLVDPGARTLRPLTLLVRRPY